MCHVKHLSIALYSRCLGVCLSIWYLSTGILHLHKGGLGWQPRITVKSNYHSNSTLLSNYTRNKPSIRCKQHVCVYSIWMLYILVDADVVQKRRTTVTFAFASASTCTILQSHLPFGTGFLSFVWRSRKFVILIRGESKRALNALETGRSVHVYLYVILHSKQVICMHDTRYRKGKGRQRACHER